MRILLLFFISFYAIKYPENIDQCSPYRYSLAVLFLEDFLIYTLSPFLSCNTVFRLPVEKFIPNSLPDITSFTKKSQLRLLPLVDITVADNI